MGILLLLLYLLLLLFLLYSGQTAELTMMLLLLLASQATAFSFFQATTRSSTMWPSTHPPPPCNNHQCEEDGLFPEGPCEPTFCQCKMGQGFLQTCKEGTFFDTNQHVCNWPWNIPACSSTPAVPATSPV